MRHDLILPHAERIVDLISFACTEVQIAGGLRRGKEEPHDIEIVALPLVVETLMDSPQPDFTYLGGVIDRLANDGILRWDTEVKRNGPRPRLAVPGGPAMNLSAERKRRVAMDAAIVIAPLFARQNWEWVTTAGVPSVEDIADAIVDILDGLSEENTLSGTGRIMVIYSPEEGQVYINLLLDQLYVGNDYDPAIDPDLSEQDTE